MKSIVAFALFIACIAVVESNFVYQALVHPKDLAVRKPPFCSENAANDYKPLPSHLNPYITTTSCGGCGNCNTCKNAHVPVCGGCGNCASCKRTYVPSCGGCGSCSSCNHAYVHYVPSYGTNHVHPVVYSHF